MMIGQFLDYMRYERNMSPLTVQTYEEALRAFESYFESKDAQLTWATVDSDIVRDWIEQMMDEKLGAWTINKKLSSLRSFYRFCLRRQLVSHDPAHAVKGPKKNKPLPQYLRESEMNRLLDEEEWDGDIYKDVRARTILLLLYEAGLRRAELTGLDDVDVDFATRQMRVVGKRSKERIVPFGEELEEELRHFMTVRDEQVAKKSGALFLSDKGERMTGNQVYQVVRGQLSRVTSMKKRSPHVLRHTFATTMLNNGAGLESIKKLLGHESLNTTEIYTHTTFEQLKRVYKEAHPRA